MVEETPGIQPHAEPPLPRHRGERDAVSFSADLPDQVRPATTPSPRGIGFRSTLGVSAEMNPVIYRPAGSGDHEPERPPRVSIAGPGVPTAASFTDDTTPVPTEPEASTDDLDEDPEIDDDELTGEAEDDLLVDDGGDGDDGLLDEVTQTPPAPVPDSTSQRRPPLQRRRRRLLGWGSDNVPEQKPEPVPEPEPASSTRSPAEPPLVAPPPPEVVEPTAVEPTVAEQTVPESDDDASSESTTSAALTRPRRVRTLHIGSPPVGPADDDVVADELAPEEADSIAAEEVSTDDPPAPLAAHDPTTSISGHVLSTRGRGLSGVSVVVIDTDDQVVGTVLTGRRGQFVVEGLRPGTSYRVGARDATDGDFLDSWHGGHDAASATALELAEDGALPRIAVTLTGRVAIDADVDVRRKKVKVAVEVIDRTTGLPGDGTVTLSTDQFSTRLPLIDGRTNITLFLTSEDIGATDKPGRRLRIEYPGSQHTGPAQRTVRLR